MKVFFSTLSAILVSAVIIWIVFSAYQTHQADLKLDAKLRQMNQDTEFSKAQREWDEQMTKDPNFDPLTQKLTARLQEIREALDNNRPIPPSPWQTPETPATNNGQSQPPAPEIQLPASEYVTLNRDVEVAHGTRKVVIPAGTKLPVELVTDVAGLERHVAQAEAARDAPGVEPVFPTKDDAISYAQARVLFRAGKIRVLDSSGNVERTIAFNESERTL